MESIIFKFQKEIIVALALILLGAGFTASYESPYDPYESRINEVDAMMQDVINNPSEEALVSAQHKLSLHGDWAYRQSDAGDFEAYLEACNGVLIQLHKYPGETPDVSNMNLCRSKLI